MGLCEPVFRGVMKKGFKVPTPIQRKAIPVALSGRDVVAMARTGSGKTAAFLVPLFERLREHQPRFDVRGIVIAPTRELAIQIHSVCKQLGRFTTIKFCLLVGGASMDKQFSALSAHPDAIVATPGRLVHHLLEVKFSLKSVEMLIFDEADRLFEMGFAPQLREVLTRVSSTRQTLLFSATMPKMVAEFARAGLRNPELIRLDVDTKVSERLSIAFFTVRRAEKQAALLYLLRHVVGEKEQTVVFAATRHHVEMLVAACRMSGFPCVPVYGSMDPTARKINIGKFRARKVPLMVVTDVAARGIDIPLLDNVINYDFPSRAKLFVHRVGRVARAGRSGSAYCLVSTDERAYMVDLYLFLGKPLLNSPASDGSRPADAKEADDEVSGARDDQPDAPPSYYGRLPSDGLREELEAFKGLMATRSSEVNLSGLVEVANRAYKMYYKTRSGASYASVERAKTLGDGIHPMFAESGDGGAADAAAGDGGEARNKVSLDGFLSSIRSYRSNKTIFEQVRTTNRAAIDAMRLKRRTHQGAIKQRLHEDQIRAESSLQQPNQETAEEPSTTNTQLAVDSANVAVREPAAATKPDTAPRVSPTGGKRRLSKRARRKLKRLREAGKAGAVVEGNEGAATPSKRARKTSDFKDPNFYMGASPSERLDSGLGVRDATRAGRIDDHVLDLAPDDLESLRQKRSVMRWDKQKKKYIRTQPGHDAASAGARRRNESGALVSKKYVPRLFEKWKQKRAGGGGKGGSVVNAEAKNELKTAAEVRRERQAKQKRAAHLRSKKSKKKAGRGRKR